MSLSSRKATVLLNVSSGWIDKPGAETTIREAFEQRGFDCEIVRASAGMDLRRMAAAALEHGACRVIAGGGDGTLRAVAEALAGTGVPMGVIPAGTLNHFARDMEIPFVLAGAAAVAAGECEVCVDIADVNGRIFINNSVIGLYPFYRGAREQEENGGRAHTVAVLAAISKMLWRYPNLTLRFRLNGRQIVRRSPYILIANNQHAMEGFKPWERESMTEGRLWIYILRDCSRMGLWRLLWKMATGGRLADDEFEALRASSATVETPRRSLRVAIDGEIATMTPPLRYRSRHGELKVLVPETSKRVIESLCPVSEKVA